ncbi:MAG: PilZ domain-containing protein [Armatimonadetes bacterium]|jgi:hypothetical protein|nr:MAG: PilZ domain-containing protein [Armatimonadota bacterium]
MVANVQIQVPNTGRVLEGVLTALDKQTMQLTARVDSGVESLRPNMLVQAVLMVGGAPRMLTVSVNPVGENIVQLTPISAAQCCERRARKRYPVSIPIEIFMNQSGAPVRVVNISIAGIGLHSSLKLETGQEFEFVLPLIGGEYPLQARAQVRHCREISDGMWYIGAAFVGLNRADELWLRKLFP